MNRKMHLLATHAPHDVCDFLLSGWQLTRTFLELLSHTELFLDLFERGYRVISKELNVSGDCVLLFFPQSWEIVAGFLTRHCYFPYFCAF